MEQGIDPLPFSHWKNIYKYEDEPVNAAVAKGILFSEGLIRSRAEQSSSLLLCRASNPPSGNGKGCQNGI
jgi:hypothetical protein